MRESLSLFISPHSSTTHCFASGAFRYACPYSKEVRSRFQKSICATRSAIAVDQPGEMIRQNAASSIHNPYFTQ